MKLLKNKKFIEIVSAIIIFMTLLAIFYVLSQCIDLNINIKIGID